MTQDTKSQTAEDAQTGKKAAAGKRKSGMAMRNKRLLFALAFLVVLIISLVLQTGTGTISAFGIGPIQAICPLGAVEAAIASKTIVPVGVLGLAITVVVVLLTGRAFCSWLCPTILVKRLFNLKSPAEREKAEAKKAAKRAEREAKAAGKTNEEVTAAGEAAAMAVVAAAEGTSEEGAEDGAKKRHLLSQRRDDMPAPERGGVSDSRNWVLGGAILSTAVFGFPVFCLVCPVGLTCASVIVIWRAFQLGETTWSLLVFPLLLVLELVVFRKWCHNLCPMGALIGLIARGNKTFKATLDSSTCLKDSRGIECNQCAKVCPEGIDLHQGALTTPRSECVKCGECSSVCPVHAITFPFLPKKGQDNGDAAVVAAVAPEANESLQA